MEREESKVVFIKGVNAEITSEGRKQAFIKRECTKKKQALHLKKRVLVLYIISP
jgi:hypothetical protein